MKNWEEIFGRPLPATAATTTVSEEDLARILEAGYVSDSDLVVLPQRIVAVAESGLIREIASVLGSSAVASCSLLLIVAIEREKAVEQLSQAIRRIDSQTNSGKQFERYEAPLSSGAAAGAWVIGLAARSTARMSLAAAALGHAATTFEIFAPEGIRKVVGAAEDVDLPFVVAVGGTLSQRLGTSATAESPFCLNSWSEPLAPKSLRGRAKYRDSLVSYFDILGFRNAVDASPSQEIESLLLRMASLSSHDTRLRLITRRGLSTFSDHVVRTVRLEGLSEAEKSEAVEVELLEVRSVQANLAGLGRFLRGGITRGPVYIDDEFVFGPALVEAYDLEHDVAKWPRIVLHEKVRPNLAAEERLAIEASDGILTLNYLAVGDDIVERVRFVESHARIVADVLANATRPYVAEKFRWLAGFHNRVAAEIPEADLTEAEVARASLIIKLKPQN